MKYFSPVGTWAERQTQKGWGNWWDATGCGKNTAPAYVTSQKAYHTGADLNLSGGADTGATVYASANGYVVYVGVCANWQGQMVVIKHPDNVWTRYAHLKDLKVSVGTNCTAQTPLGVITDYTPTGSASGDHLHFDIAKIDLGAKPCDWPAMDLARLEASYFDPLQFILAHAEDAPTVAQWTPTSTDGTRVRLSPDTTSTSNIVGVLPYGSSVDGIVSTDGKWIEINIKPEKITANGVMLLPSTISTFKAHVSSTFMKPYTPPVVPPIPPSNSAIGTHPALPALAFNKRLGVHTLERIEEAREAFDLGCRSFTIMNNVAGAREMKAKGAAVIVRCYMDGGQLWSVDQFITRYGLNADDSFVVMGINEADNISTSEIEKRFAWEKEFALKMHTVSPKSFIVIGSFSMGTPQLDNPDVAKRFKDTYATFLNANASWCGINYHSYQRRHSEQLPPFNQAVESADWYSKRFLVWGYNPLAGGLNSNVVCVSDEAGVDIGGVGGFPACGYTDTYFAGWYALHKSWFEPYPQVYTQNIFQFSPRVDWAGYNARIVLGGLTKVWQG